MSAEARRSVSSVGPSRASSSSEDSATLLGRLSSAWARRRARRVRSGADRPRPSSAGAALPDTFAPGLAPRPAPGPTRGKPPAEAPEPSTEGPLPGHCPGHPESGRSSARRGPGGSAPPVVVRVTGPRRLCSVAGAICRNTSTAGTARPPPAPAHSVRRRHLLPGRRAAPPGDRSLPESSRNRARAEGGSGRPPLRNRPPRAAPGSLSRGDPSPVVPRRGASPAGQRHQSS